MTRFARTINVMTKIETLVPFTKAEEAAANAGAAKEAEESKTPPRDVLAELTAIRNALIDKDIITDTVG